MYPLMGYLLKYRKETNQELTHFCALVRENSSLFARPHNISCGSKFFASRPKWKFAPQQKLCLQTGKYLGRHWHHKYFLLSGDLDNRWAEGALAPAPPPPPPHNPHFLVLLKKLKEKVGEFISFRVDQFSVFPS